MEQRARELFTALKCDFIMSLEKRKKDEFFRNSDVPLDLLNSATSALFDGLDHRFQTFNFCLFRNPQISDLSAVQRLSLNYDFVQR